MGGLVSGVMVNTSGNNPEDEGSNPSLPTKSKSMKVKVQIIGNDDHYEIKSPMHFLPSSGDTLIFNFEKYKVREVIHDTCENNSNQAVEVLLRVSMPQSRQPVERHPEISAEVLNYLYGTLLKQRNDFTPENVPKAFLEFISARVNEGHTVDEMKAVAYIKHKEWKGTKDEKYIRADTLYRPTNFQRYLAEVQAKKPKWNVVSTKEQKAIIKQLNSYGVRGERNEETDRLAKELMATGYNKKEFLNLYLKEQI